MKTLIIKSSKLWLLSIAVLISFNAYSQGWNPDLEEECKEALAEMLADAPNLQTYLDEAVGYALYPKITKAALIIGGGAGEGMVFKKGGEPIGKSKIKQGTFGLQAGGQQYSEVIFFENVEAFDKFKNGNLKFDSQVSAVAIVGGASVDNAYDKGVAVFTRAKGGLMAEASLGGQHFSFVPLQ